MAPNTTVRLVQLPVSETCDSLLVMVFWRKLLFFFISDFHGEWIISLRISCHENKQIINNDSDTATVSHVTHTINAQSVANTPVMAGGKVATSSGELAAKGTENEMPEASRGWGLLPPQPTNRSEGALWLWMWAPPVGSKKRKTNLSHSEHNWTLF